jgi:diguanylate cyclase (GGDEF)-like protein
MRIIRSARGFAAATVGVMLALLIGTTAVAMFGNRTQHSHLDSLEATSLYAGALQAARAEFLGASADLAAAGFTQDQTYFLMYQNDIAITRQQLLQAHATALSEERETDAVLVDGFVERVDSYDQGVRDTLALILAGNEERATEAQNELTAAASKLQEDLQLASEREQASVSAQRAAAEETSDGSFWAQLILGVFALATGAVAGGALVIRTRQMELNIEQRKQAEGRITYLAYHDALTNLPNRTLLEDRLATALAQARRRDRMLALLYLDLDRFKRVNETIGHALGDQVLQSVVERLVAIVREADTVARVGGDEFAILLPEISRVQDAVDVAERVLHGLRQPLAIEHRELHATVSTGIAVHPNDAEEADTLMRNAAIAMYRAKEQGGDNYQLYAPAMNAPIADPLALESELRRALEREEFVLYYQPQVSIADWQIVGVEALIRWQHPKRGLVLPSAFIPMAEETGLIVSLGEWVLRTACAQAKAWQEAGLPALRVAANISGRHFQLRSLVNVVGQVLRETALDPHWLQLEITETVAVQDVDFTSRMLGELREMGVQIAIDDFGNGHSSLNYLKRLPIDDVKIDQYFVRDVTTDPNDAAIVGSIVAMAHGLNLKVVAEGVETQQQLAFLKDRRCDVVQGSLFSEPVPADAIQQIVARGPRLPAIASARWPAYRYSASATLAERRRPDLDPSSG